MRNTIKIPLTVIGTVIVLLTALVIYGSSIDTDTTPVQEPTQKVKPPEPIQEPETEPIQETSTTPDTTQPETDTFVRKWQPTCTEHAETAKEAINNLSVIYDQLIAYEKHGIYPEATSDIAIEHDNYTRTIHIATNKLVSLGCVDPDEAKETLAIFKYYIEEIDEILNNSDN